MSEYIKKEDALTAMCDCCACGDNGIYPCPLVEHGECTKDERIAIDHLTTYSFPDSAEDNTMDIYSDLLRVKHGTMSIDSLIDKVWCGRKAVKI